MTKSASTSSGIVRCAVGTTLAVLVAVSATLHNKTALNAKTTVAKTDNGSVVVAGIKEYFPPTPPGLSFS